MSKKANKIPKRKKQGICRIVSNNLRIVAKVARLAPDYFISVIVEGIIWGIINSAMSIFTVYLFDALDSIDEGTTFKEVALIIGAMAVFYLLAYAFDAWYWRIYNPLLRQKLELRLHRELFEKSQTLDVSCYDDPEFYNDFVWAMDEAGARAYEVMSDIGAMIHRLVLGGTLFTLMFSIDKIVGVILLVSAILSTVIYRVGNRVWFNHEKEAKPLWRKKDYINRVFNLPEYSKELRISHASDLLIDEMDENLEKVVAVEKKYGKKYFLLYGVLNNLILHAVHYGVILYMLYQLVNGNVLIGAFAASINVIWRVRWALSDFVERITKFPKHSLFLEKYYGFLSYEPRTLSGKRAVPGFESLELKNVSFTYDFSHNPKYEYGEKKEKEKHSEKSGEALRNVSLTLKRGEKIAIVGYNGAGKTTLIKLLMRLYDPTEGEILFNGVDIREYELNEYRNRIGTVFQDFKIFAASIGENVMNGGYDPTTERETVIAALDASGFTSKLKELENGVDTVLTREFDDKGTNLSGGEGQKVAIARVFAKPFELIIMDEPSSALDPIAEYELNQAILKYASDKTVIFISHRLSTTRMADRIYMFVGGELTECGSHDELMTQNGKYAEMFNLQAEKYKKD
ncbi:MAG: ABC transporter ATP-binding protein [Clostridia bacterium]|nr:ABC transporter ATP-binding protein [Clostridia bacterium]